MSANSFPSVDLTSPQEDLYHKAKETTATERRILRKLDLHILPLLTSLWFVCFTDRANIGNAKIAGLERDTGLVGNQFNVVLAILYVTYSLVQTPSNLVLKKLGANRWIPFLTASWGTITILTSQARSFTGLVTVRIFLGLCEGGLLTGLVLYMSTLYKRHELQQRVGILFSAGCLSGAFGGLLASVIIKMDGIRGIAGWRWIFILEGTATVLLSIIAAVFIPADLASARFLTEEERKFAVTRLCIRSDTVSNYDGPPSPIKSTKEEFSVDIFEQVSQTTMMHYENEQFEWREVIRGILDVQVWLSGICYMGVLVSLYSLTFFLPTIVTGLGYSGEAAQLHSCPPYVPATILTVVVSIVSDRLKLKGPMVLIILPLAITGYIIAIVATDDTQRYVAVFLITSGTWPCVPCILALITNNAAAHYKRATAAGVQITVANVAGFIGTFIYTSDQQPHYVRGHSITLAFLVAAWLFMAANVWYCVWENRARAAGRRQSNIQKYEALVNAGKTRAPIGDRHPDFRFTL